MSKSKKRSNDVALVALTTSEAARLCGLAPRTICKAADRGVLPCYRVPGGKDRRIPRAGLIEYLRKNGIPLPPGERPRPCRVLLVGCAGPLGSALRRLLPACDGWDLVEAQNVYEAGCCATLARPDVAVLDTALGAPEVAELARHLGLRGNGPHVVALTGEDGGNTPAGCDQYVQKPLDPAHLAAVLAARKGGAT